MNKMNVAKICIIGDGHLYEKYISNGISPCLTLEHSINQKDYLIFKKKLLEKEFDSNGISVHTRPNRPMVSARISSRKLLKGFRAEFYPENKKDIVKLVNSIESEFYSLLLAIWFGDDGCVYASTGSKNKYPRLSLASCENQEQTEELMKWFTVNFDVVPFIKTQKSGFDKQKTHSLISFNVADSKKLFDIFWDIIKDIPSMQYKFRYFLEQNITSPRVSDTLQSEGENVCRTSQRCEEVLDKKPIR